ncbi:MAG: DUF488 family protein [Armatimonadota bacterium]
MGAPEVHTIGHSTRTLDEFIGLLRAHGIETVVDVRTVPRSRRVPQFDRETLPRALDAVGIGYLHMKALGGWRHARKDSPNTGWRNAGFRGYADYMLTGEFEAAVNELTQLATDTRIAIMCAEAVPWRCHRWLLSDALVVRGVEVRHITSAAAPEAHKLTEFAVVKEGTITYPAPGTGQPRLDGL